MEDKYQVIWKDDGQPFSMYFEFIDSAYKWLRHLKICARYDGKIREIEFIRIT